MSVITILLNIKISDFIFSLFFIDNFIYFSFVFQTAKTAAKTAKKATKASKKAAPKAAAKK